MPTFAELGIDFPLFAADVSESTDWQPTGVCAICSVERAGFEIGIGAYVDNTCRHCASATPAPADGTGEACVRCGQTVELGRDLTQMHGCWACLRSGRWSSTQDTEAGMVTPAHALLGYTHGLPFPPGALANTAWAGIEAARPTLAGWPTGDANEDGWRAAIVPTEVLLELVRSPTYNTWQGEQWLFHCERAMRYLGRWGREEFESAAEAEAPADLATRAAGVHRDVWESLGRRADDSAVSVYMFDCPVCGTHRGHWDID